MIKEFDPVIYPFRLWVAKDTTIEEIDRHFEAICDDLTGTSFKDNHTLPDSRTAAARTYIVGHKKSGYMGCLVYLPKGTPLKILSHEADHCADWLFEQIGEDKRSYNNGEPYAYYQSWVFECLYKVKSGK